MWRFKILKSYKRKHFTTKYVLFEDEIYIVHENI